MPVSSNAIALQFKQFDDKLEAGHLRLRGDFQEMRIRLETFEKLLTKHEAHLTQIDSAPISPNRILFTPQIVIAIVFSVVTIIAGQWAITDGIRSSLRDVVSNTAAQTKIQDERSVTLTKTIDEIKRTQTLQQYDIKELHDLISTQKIAGNK